MPADATRGPERAIPSCVHDVAPIPWVSLSWDVLLDVPSCPPEPPYWSAAIAACGQAYQFLRISLISVLSTAMGANSAVPRVRLRSGRRPTATEGQLLGDPPRVLVADDHLSVRVGTRLALEEAGFVVCAEAADGPSTVEAARRERPDVCLIDVMMPGAGIEAAAQIAAELPDVAIVMLTVSDHEPHLYDAIRAGASGYLLKDVDLDLPAALAGVLSGEAAFPRRLVTRLIEEFNERQRHRVPVLAAGRAELTGREWRRSSCCGPANAPPRWRAVSASARSRCAATCPSS
jgi:DNA-binding NarL/FixJ family response regulator